MQAHLNSEFEIPRARRAHAAYGILDVGNEQSSGDRLTSTGTLKVANVVEGRILTKPKEAEKNLTWAKVASASAVRLK
jgi:hypothetical protein